MLTFGQEILEIEEIPFTPTKVSTRPLDEDSDGWESFFKEHKIGIPPKEAVLHLSHCYKNVSKARPTYNVGVYQDQTTKAYWWSFIDRHINKRGENMCGPHSFMHESFESIVNVLGVHRYELERLV